MSAVIRWEPPPAARRASSEPPSEFDHHGIAAELRARPGDWAVVCESGTNPALTARINRGELSAYRPAGCFEAVCRANGSGVLVIYARYLGDPEGDPP